MSVEVFCYRLSKAQVPAKDKMWMPKWLEKYATTVGVTADKNLNVTSESVLEFLVRLKKGSTPAWQRLQAMRALELYQKLVLDGSSVDFSNFRKGLLMLVAREKGSKIQHGESELEGIPGEGMAGLIDESEPAPVQNLRKRMRLLHHPRSTEETYTMWLNRFVRFWDTESLSGLGEQHIGVFLTDLAISAQVVAGTQDQALHALLFYFQHVEGREMHFVERVRAKSSTYLPVVLSRDEISNVNSLLRGSHGLMFRIMYGGGLRHKECRSLRIKDLCFDMSQIVVRNGKGSKDRVTVLGLVRK